jgi:hypothetical protein
MDPWLPLSFLISSSLCLLKELLKVVRGQPCLMLATVCDTHVAHHNEVAYLLVDATVVIGRGLLAVLLAHLLAALGTLLDIQDDDIR